MRGTIRQNARQMPGGVPRHPQCGSRELSLTIKVCDLLICLTAPAGVGEVSHA
jgi:hypothetical protein